MRKLITVLTAAAVLVLGSCHLVKAENVKVPVRTLDRKQGWLAKMKGTSLE
jgi:hypothetical protein